MSCVSGLRNFTIFFAPTLLLLASSAAQDHPDLSGSWKLNVAGSKIKDPKLSTECAKLTIALKDESITLSESDGQQVVCTTAGKECETKGSKVSFWYNGPKLVQMEIKGHAGEHIRKRRLGLSPDGKTLEMEVIPISPGGEASLLAFEKEQ
jgi:hypothetical protein